MIALIASIAATLTPCTARAQFVDTSSITSATVVHPDFFSTTRNVAQSVPITVAAGVSASAESVSVPVAFAATSTFAAFYTLARSSSILLNLEFCILGLLLLISTKFCSTPKATNPLTTARPRSSLATS